jgi:nitrous oxide reductase accessory protein NosL
VPFEKAFYVVGSSVKTPSGYGIIAFKNKSSANKFAKKEGGKVVKFYEISILEIK